MTQKIMELKIVTKGIKKKKFFMPENVEAIEGWPSHKGFLFDE